MYWFQVLWLFFCYSFLGWVLEVVFEAAVNRRYVDRGVLNGPLCVIYGVAGTIISVGFVELKESVFFLFLFGALVATVVEWVAGHALETMTHTRWWDYSHLPWNLDGYICLGASALWGALGVVMVLWGNPLLLLPYSLLPALVRRILLWVALGLLAVDALDTALTLLGLHARMPQVEQVGNRLAAVTLRAGHWILSRTERRMQKAVPAVSIVRPAKKEKAAGFAQGADFYKIALLFFIGAFLGDITETIFCRVTAGIWMSRSSVVWGPFSIVWGLAIALVTKLLYRYKDRPSSYLFVAGTLLGGAYEYLCSVFTELVFGTVFWDYSEIPFNLGGRINLLYCFFWGFAAVVWFKVLYPPVGRWIEKLPVTPGKVLTWALVLFMTVDILVSSAAMLRQGQRAEGIPADTPAAIWLDEHYDDDTMRRIYPNAIKTS